LIASPESGIADRASGEHCPKTLVEKCRPKNPAGNSRLQTTANVALKQVLHTGNPDAALVAYERVLQAQSRPFTRDTATLACLVIAAGHTRAVSRSVHPLSASPLILTKLRGVGTSHCQFSAAAQPQLPCTLPRPSSELTELLALQQHPSTSSLAAPRSSKRMGKMAFRQQRGASHANGQPSQPPAVVAEPSIQAPRRNARLIQHQHVTGEGPLPPLRPCAPALRDTWNRGAPPNSSQDVKVNGYGPPRRSSGPGLSFGIPSSASAAYGSSTAGPGGLFTPCSSRGAPPPHPSGPPPYDYRQIAPSFHSGRGSSHHVQSPAYTGYGSSTGGFACGHASLLHAASLQIPSPAYSNDRLTPSGPLNPHYNPCQNDGQCTQVGAPSADGFMCNFPAHGPDVSYDPWSLSWPNDNGASPQVVPSQGYGGNASLPGYPNNRYGAPSQTGGHNMQLQVPSRAYTSHGPSDASPDNSPYLLWDPSTAPNNHAMSQQVPQQALDAHDFSAGGAYNGYSSSWQSARHGTPMQVPSSALAAHGSSSTGYHNDGYNGDYIPPSQSGRMNAFSPTLPAVSAAHISSRTGQQRMTIFTPQSGHDGQPLGLTPHANATIHACTGSYGNQYPPAAQPRDSVVSGQLPPPPNAMHGSSLRGSASEYLPSAGPSNSGMSLTRSFAEVTISPTSPDKQHSPAPQPSNDRQSRDTILDAPSKRGGSTVESDHLHALPSQSGEGTQPLAMPYSSANITDDGSNPDTNRANTSGPEFIVHGHLVRVRLPEPTTYGFSAGHSEDGATADPVPGPSTYDAIPAPSSYGESTPGSNRVDGLDSQERRQ